MAKDDLNLPKNIGRPRSIPVRYLPTQGKLTTDYIQWANSSQDVQRRRAESQQIIIGQTYRANGPQAANTLANYAKAYPNMSPNVMLALTKGQSWLPPDQRRLPVSQQKWLLPVAEPDPALGIANEDFQQQVDDETYGPNLPPVPQPGSPEQAALQASGGGGLIQAPIDIVNVAKWATSGVLSALGYGVQAPLNVGRQYYGEIDNALYLKDKYQLSDDEFQEIFADRPDVLDAVGGGLISDLKQRLFPAVADSGGNPLQVAVRSGLEIADLAAERATGRSLPIDQFAGEGLATVTADNLQGIAYDPSRRDGTGYTGDPVRRLDEARAEAQRFRSSKSDAIWRNTAVGQWYNNLRSGDPAMWIPAREYQQVENRMAGVADGDYATAFKNGQTSFMGPGSLNLLTDSQREQAYAEAKRYYEHRVTRNLVVETERIANLVGPHQYTLGRGLLWNIDEDPDSFAQRVGSGFIDAAVAFADPLGWVPVGKAARGATTALRAIKPGTVGETIRATRRAAKNPLIRELLLPEDVSDAVTRNFSGPKGVADNALDASATLSRAQEALLNATERIKATEPVVRFDERGVGSVLDQQGTELLTGGVRRTMTGQGQAITYRSKSAARSAAKKGYTDAGDSVTVTIETRPILDKAQQVQGYGLFRTTQLDSGDTVTSRLRGTWDSADEADAAATGKYMQDSEEVAGATAEYRQAVKDEQVMRDWVSESTAEIAGKYRQAFEARTTRLRVSGRKDNGNWYLHDASEKPFTQAHIRQARVQTGTRQVSENFTINETKRGFSVAEKGQRKAQRFATREEATRYVQDTVSARNSGFTADGITADSKLVKGADGSWESASGHKVTGSKGAYTVYRADGTVMKATGTYKTWQAAQAAVKREADEARTARVSADTLADEPILADGFSLHDGVDEIGTFGTFDEAVNALLEHGAQVRAQRLERIAAKVDGLKVIKGSADTALNAKQQAAATAKATLDDVSDPATTPSTYQTKYIDEATGIAQADPEDVLISRWLDGEVSNLADLQGAVQIAKTKRGTVPFVTNERMWRALTETVEGQKVIAWLVGQNSADAIMRRMTTLNAEHAVALAQARNANEVTTIMSNLIGPQYDFTDFARFSWLSNARVKGSNAIANSRLMGPLYRLSQFAPHGNVVDGDDLDGTYKEVRRFAEGLGAKPEDVAPYLDTLLMNTRNGAERYEVIYGAHGLIENVAKKALKERGVKEARINKITTAFAGGTDVSQRRRLGVSKSSDLATMSATEQTLDAVRKGTYPVPITGDSQEYALLAHMYLDRNIIVLPDYRNARRAINLLARAENYLGKHDPTGETPLNDWFSRGTNTVITGWRNMVLVTGARAVRDLADLQMRFGAAGGPSILTSPFAFFANAVFASYARQSQTGFRSVMKGAPLLFVPQMIKFLRRSAPNFDDTRYRGSYLISGDGLSRLITPDLAEDMTGATRWQSMRVIENGHEPQAFDTAEDFLADVSRKGVVDPITVVYDPNRNGYRILDGGKRARAAVQLRTQAVPIKVVKGTIDDGQDYVKAASDDGRNWRRWSNIAGSEDGYIGGTLETIEKTRAAVRKDSAWQRGMKALMPGADREWARANGQGYLDDFNAVVSGEASEETLSALSLQSTTFMGNFGLDQHLSSGLGRTLGTYTKADPKTHQLYAKAWADRAGELRTLPHVGDLLNGRKDIDDVVEEIMADPVKRSEYLTMINAQALDGRKTSGIEETLELLRQDNQGLDTFIRGQYQTILNAIDDLSGQGNHADLFEAIVTGKYKGKALNRTNSELTREVLRKLQGDSQSGYVDAFLPDALQGADENAMYQVGHEFIDRFFDAQGEVMDVFGMVGPQRTRYRENVAEAARYLSDADREALATRIASRGDKKLAQQVRRVQAMDNEASLFDPETIDKIAMRKTADEMKKVFYDAHQRRNWALALRVVAPFAQASANTVYTWGRLMASNPENAYRTYKPIQALMEPESDALSDLMDGDLTQENPYGQGRGFFTNDPGSGMRTFNYPMIDSVMGKLVNGLTPGSDINFELQANAQSLNPWQSGAASGLSPVFTAPLATFAPEASIQDGMFGQFLRFQGVEPPRGHGFYEQMVEQFMPLKANDLVVEGDRKKGDLFVSNLATEVASGRYDMSNPADRQLAQEAAQKKMQVQMFMEGMLEIFAPTFGSLNAKTRIPIGSTVSKDTIGGVDADIVGSVLLDEARSAYYKYLKSTDGSVKSEDELDAARDAFYEDYGIGPVLAAQAMIQEKDSMPLSGSAYDFRSDNPEWFDDNVDVVRYLFPSDEVYGAALSSGVRNMSSYYTNKGSRFLTFDDIRSMAMREFGERWKANVALKAAQANGGALSPYAQQAIEAEADVSALDGRWVLPMGKDAGDVVTQIETSLSKLPEQERAQMPGNAQVTAYLNERKRWTDPQLSSWLYTYGNSLVGQDPTGAFSTFWMKIGSKEFTETAKAGSSWTD